MQVIGAFEAKTHFSALLDKIEKKGEVVVITKHGREIAKLVPSRTKNQLSIKETIQHLKEFAKQNILGDLNWKTLRDEGRK